MTTGARPTSARAAGFTLVELLVALLIFGLLSAAATALLSFGIDARARTAERLDALSAVVRTRTMLTADLAQAAPRQWRDINGAQQPAFLVTDGAAPRLAFVRRGWRNDGGAARSSLQRVEYRLADGRLERASAPMVDGAEWLPPAVLLTDVTNLQMRFHTGGQWLDRWQPEITTTMPDAVELTIVTRREPALRQLFVVGPGPATS